MRDAIAEILRQLLALVTKPGPLYFTIDQWGDNMARFKVRVLLPATRVADAVTQREITVTVNDTARPAEMLAADAGQYDFEANEDDRVKVSLVDLDQRGNRSMPSERETVVTDTIPPHQPGDLAMTVIEQVEEPPAPTPQP